MTMGHSRLGPNRETLPIPNALAAGTHQFTIGECEFDGEVVRFEFTNDAAVTAHADNFFSISLIKRDMAFAVDRLIAFRTTELDAVPAGTNITADDTEQLTLVTTADAVNYPPPGLPQMYRRYRQNDRLVLQIIVAGAGVTPVNMVCRLSTIDSAQTVAKV